MSFENAKQLRAHKNMHLDNYTYLCSFCSLGVNQNGFSHQSSFVNFPSREKLLAHIAENHPHACDICSLVFSKRSSLQEHIEAKHSGKPVEERQKHTCSIQSCRKAFTRQSNLSSHYRTQHERKRFICGETDLSLVKGLTDWKNENSCGEQYKWKNGLINHVKKYHLGGEQIVRQSEKPTRKSKNTAISKLTGLDAGKGQIESLRCFDMFCYEQFPNQSSLEFHARQDHGMNDGDIAEALAEQEALQGGPFWIGGGDEQDSQFATADGGSLQPQDYEVPRLLSQSELFILEGYNAEGPSGVIDPALLHTG
ncbi:MAG: Strongly-conserved Zn-finger binding protein (TFIIIA) [Alyxoria varia]|nr:MAG: Strongly-conserved Zn-finger binding protein (TFIIIA) [Alyxoria varia]